MAPAKQPSAKSHGTVRREPLTVSLSAIIASIWVGVWGFEWAATHLSGDELFIAVLAGLVFGTGMTVYAVERPFNAVRIALEPQAGDIPAREPRASVTANRGPVIVRAQSMVPEMAGLSSTEQLLEAEGDGPT